MTDAWGHLAGSLACASVSPGGLDLRQTGTETTQVMEGRGSVGHSISWLCSELDCDPNSWPGEAGSAHNLGVQVVISGVPGVQLRQRHELEGRKMRGLCGWEALDSHSRQEKSDFLGRGEGPHCHSVLHSSVFRGERGNAQKGLRTLSSISLELPPGGKARPGCLHRPQPLF